MAAKKKNKTTDQPDNASDATIGEADDNRGSRSDVPVGVLIEVRAYEIFLQRGDGHGDSVSDWLSAEQQIREELGLTSPSEPAAESEPEPDSAKRSSRAAS